jgi:hypothetical protein
LLISWGKRGLEQIDYQLYVRVREARVAPSALLQGLN